MFECHITIDPVFDERRASAEQLAGNFGFKLAKLYMDKGVPSQKDTFMTGHSPVHETLSTTMRLLISSLQANGYTVRRYKIERILLDSKYQADPLGLL